MRAYLYKNNLDERYVDKMNGLEELHGDIPCDFKEDTDLIRPTLIFDYGIVPNVNYVWLSEVARYYFVRNRTYSQGRIYLECEEDVLMTYRTQLKAQTVVIKRQRNNYDLNQIDSEWTTEGYTATRTIPFPNGFKESEPEWVLGIAGGEGVQNGSEQ